MARTPQDVTDKELEILHVLWDEGPATIQQIVDRLYPGGGVSKYATVQKLLERLESDGCVVRERGGKAHTFAAAVEKDELIGRRLRSVAEKLCGGSVTPILTHLVRTRQLSARERAELRALIDEMDEKGRKKSDRK
jgi:BlaI family transcriptional regulator, penicillinase repressor